MNENAPAGILELPCLSSSVRRTLEILEKEDPEGIYSAESLGISEEEINAVLARHDPAELLDPETRLHQIKMAVEFISEDQFFDFPVYAEEPVIIGEYQADDKKVLEHGKISPAVGSIHNPISIDDGDDEVLGYISPADDNGSVHSEDSDINERSHPAHTSEIDTSSDPEGVEIQNDDGVRSCSESGSEDGNRVSGYVEVLDDEAASEDDASDTSDGDSSDIGSQYGDAADGVGFPSSSKHVTSENYGALTEAHDQFAEHALGFAGHDNGAYYGYAGNPTSIIPPGNNTPLPSSRKRACEDASRFDVEDDSDDEPLMKKARFQKYQSNFASGTLSGGKQPHATKGLPAGKDLPASGRSIDEDALPGQENSLRSETLLGAENSVGDEPILDRRLPFGGKCLPGTVDPDPFRRHPTPEDDDDNDIPNNDSAPPPLAPSRAGRRAWSDDEHVAIEKVVRAIRSDEREKGLIGKLGLRDEKLWRLVSHTLKQDHGIDRTLSGCKYYWSRFGRTKSDFDERAVQNDCKSTSVQHRRS